jgi:putative transposase
LHKSSNWITEKLNYNLIIGKLDLNNMKSNQTWFNKILLNEWRIGKFVEMLIYKSKKYGKQLIKIDESYTSKTCFKCNSIKENLKLSDREYNCSCGFNIDRDINGALNIMKKYSTASADKIRNNLVEFSKINNLNIFKYI